MSRNNFIPTPQSYRFEFGSDENLYTVSFQGNLPKEAPDKILETAEKHTYEKSGETIHAYLEKHQLEYSHFEFKKTYLKHKKIMEWANTLLQSDACNTINTHIGNWDHYYCIMDYQKWIQKEQCEGCYLAIKRNVSNMIYDRSFKYNIIGQTFIFNESLDESISYFTIRRKDGHSLFHNLFISKGRPVLPTFGCVDMIELLREIEKIHNAKQAQIVAIK